MKVGSLFSGIGGLDKGLEMAGMEVVWQCEIDRQCGTVLAKHWPDVPVYDDVKEIDGSAPRVDVLCGGFPCQDVSVAGRRAGLAGERSGLFFEFTRIATALTPRWLLIENVPGLLSSCGCPECRPPDDEDTDDESVIAERTKPDHQGRDMATVLGTLGELGYGWAYRVLDAQYLGVAQRRRRVFIVGCLGDPASAAQVLFESESCDRDSPPRREARQAVAALTANGVGTCGADDNQGQAGHLIADTLRSHPRPGSNSSGALVEVAPTLESGTNETGGTRPPGTTVDTVESLVVANNTGQGWWTEDEVASHLSARDYKDPHTVIGFHQTQDPISEEESTPALGTTSQGMGVAYSTKMHNTKSNQAGKFYKEYSPSLQADSPPPVVAFSENQRGEVVESEAAHQLTTGGGKPGQGYPAVREGMQVRRLTPLECERLQGFPDGWTAELNDGARYRTLGNAVAVPVAHWIGKRMKEVE